MVHATSPGIFWLVTSSPDSPSQALSVARLGPSRGVLLSLAYRLLRCVVGLLAVLARSDLSKDAEPLVLRHENQVLRRQLTGRLRWDHADRVSRKWTYTDRCWREAGVPPRRGTGWVSGRLPGMPAATCEALTTRSQS
jgi:hypothetical protein